MHLKVNSVKSWQLCGVEQFKLLYVQNQITSDTGNLGMLEIFSRSGDIKGGRNSEHFRFISCAPQGTLYFFKRIDEYSLT